MGYFSAKIGCLLLPLLIHGCGPFPDLRGLVTGDIEPPIFLGCASTTATSVTMQFNEPVTSAVDSIALTPTIQPLSVDCTGNGIEVIFAQPLQPGAEYFIEATAKDSGGNIIRLLAPIYGHNPRVPAVLINEFTTRGSSSHPDLVEILVLSPGNLSGLCVYEGVAENWTDRCILPDTEVSAGDFLVLHFKPEGIKEEVDETTAPDISGGRDASATAFDFWVPGGNGLSGNNGVVSVYSSPGGEIIDAVLYSNRTSASDDKYRGFGSRDMMERADLLQEHDAWQSSEETISPEDAVNPDDSTSTRSINRFTVQEDTDSSADWYTVPTRGSSFGYENTISIYQKEE